MSRRKRFEALELPGGSATVADLALGRAAVTSRAWNRADAEAAAEALNEHPAYVVAWTWSASVVEGA